MNENGNNVNLKVAVLNEKVEHIDQKIDKLEEILLHKFRNQENQIKFVYDDIQEIHNKIKYLTIAASILFFLVQGGLIEFVKGLMQ